MFNLQYIPQQEINFLLKYAEQFQSGVPVPSEI